MAKRLLDMLLSGGGLIVSAPLWAAIAALIKIEDGGPVFFSQERVGHLAARPGATILTLRDEPGGVLLGSVWLEPQAADARLNVELEPGLPMVAQPVSGPVAMAFAWVSPDTAQSVRDANWWAPRWMQRVGLEWAWRLGSEPRRLWHRYLVADLPILARGVARRIARPAGVA